MSVTYHNCKNCGASIDLRLDQCDYCGSFFKERPKIVEKPIPDPTPSSESTEPSEPSTQRFTYNDPKYSGLYKSEEEPDTLWENAVTVVVNCGMLFLVIWLFKIM